MRQALEDSRVTYVLGYYPTHDSWDGRFRQLKVQVKRKGLNVRHRAGYFAFHERQETPKERDQLLREAVGAPLEATGIPLLVRVGPGKPPKPGRWQVTALVDPRHISLSQQGDRWVGSLDVLLVQQSPDGRTLRAARDNLALRLTQQAYQRVNQEGVILVEVLDVLPATAQVRVVVRDPASGNLGSVTVPVGKVTL